MNIFKQYKYGLAVAVIPAFLLGACGGASSSTEIPAPTKGKLSVAITDAPIDEAALVNVQFTGIEIKPASGSSIVVDLDEMNIDLLSLQDGGSTLMLNDLEVPSGTYNWIRLAVNAEQDTLDSFLQTNLDDDSSKTSLWVPGGNQTGLKLNSSFVVTAGGAINLTIDFDLRKSIANPIGLGQTDNLILKPSLRMVDDSKVGEISGAVDVALINGEGCTDSSAVYVFAGDVEEDDIDINEDGTSLGGEDPVTTANVTAETDSTTAEVTYHYTAAFLEAGTYTVAFTCQAANDDPAIDNDDALTNNGLEVSFFGSTPVEVAADAVTTQDFAPDPTPAT